MTVALNFYCSCVLVLIDCLQQTIRNTHWINAGELIKIYEISLTRSQPLKTQFC